MAVAIEGLAKPIGTTPNHPFWSESLQEFVRAVALRPGEHVRTLEGTAQVVSITERGPPEPVFNLEVHLDHVYHVAQCGVLVHNGGLTVLNPCFAPSNQARRDFGTAVHQEFPEEFAKKYPGVRFRDNVGPGQNGPDIEVVSANRPGFDFADLKPKTESGFRSFEKQLENWGDGDAALFFYDPATGVIDIDNPFIYRQK